MSNVVGNEENMAKVQALMAQAVDPNSAEVIANEVKQGDKASNVLEIDFISASGEHYKGDITVKRPNMQALMKMGTHKAQLLGSYGAVNMDLVDGGVIYMAQCVATLKVAIETAPKWLIDAKTKRLNIEGVYDADLIYHIYDLYEVWESNFRQPIQRQEDGNSEPTEGA